MLLLLLLLLLLPSDAFAAAEAATGFLAATTATHEQCERFAEQRPRARKTAALGAMAALIAAVWSSLLLLHR